MQFQKVYFYTATIKDWHPAIAEHSFQTIILQSLKHLSNLKLIQVYAFVIMPNHIHLIWQMMQANKKETPVASFMKFTAHEFLKVLKRKDLKTLKAHEVDWVNRKHNFWQRDSMAVELFTEKVLLQKLHYIHTNPLQEKWRLVEKAEDYPFSSAKFYFTGGQDQTFDFFNSLPRQIVKCEGRL